MRLLIQHCNQVVFKDKKESKDRSQRPVGITQFPPSAGEADIEFRTPVPGLYIYDDPQRNRIAQKILSEFEKVKFFSSRNSEETWDSPIHIRLDYLVEKTGLRKEAEVNRILRRLNAMGLLRGLTIDYDHSKWMKHSNIKGCLVLNVCIQKSDYAKNDIEKKVVKEVNKLKEVILYGDMKKGKLKRYHTKRKPNLTLKDVFVIPNAHLTPPRYLGGDPQKDILILRKIKEELEKNGYCAKLNSYGYAKDIVQAINAHKMGYVLRTL